MTTTAITQDEEAQLQQTIEMFEVIVQSQPNDCQSLEILKEAYSKLGREQEVVNTSKRIAQAYMQMGQLSSAILEFETVLQRRPDDVEVQKALQEIESKATSAADQSPGDEPAALVPLADAKQNGKAKMRAPLNRELDDGRKTMRKVFVDQKVISAGDFDLCWRAVDLSQPPADVVDPFIQLLADKGILPLEQSLKILSDKSRSAFLPLDKYDVDIDLTRGFPAEVCRRWCVLPFDRMSKAILVATANPFNQQAMQELSETTSYRLIWYLCSPTELVKNVRKAFR